MNEKSRLFDFLKNQLEHFPKPDMIAGKENGQWKLYSTAEVTSMVNNLSIALIQLGISGKDMTVENQDKIAIISKNRSEWLMLDMACQQIGAVLCPIYPTTSINELEFIFNDAGVKLAFVSGQEIMDKVTAVRDKVPSLMNVYSFDELPGVDFWKTILPTPNEADHAQLEKIKSSILAEHCATIIYTSGNTGTP